MATPRHARYGYYRGKIGSGYLALDDGGEFVTTIANGVEKVAEAHVLVGLANDAMSIRERTDWRARLARWLLFRGDGWS